MMFMHLSDAVEYAQRLVRKGRATHHSPAIIGWVIEGSKYVFYVLPSGGDRPEGFVTSLMLPNGLE